MIVANNIDKIIYEVVYSKPSKYDTLFYVADKLLRPTIEKMCYKDKRLRGRQYEDDILIEIKVRLYKYSERNFFCSKPGEINSDARQFKSWLFAVAKTTFITFAKTHGIYESINVLTDDIRDLPPGEEFNDYNREKLLCAFDRILEKNVSIYKTLTWMAMFFLILRFCEKKESVDVIVNMFSEMTLDEMYGFILDYVNNVDWIMISPSQHSKIKTALDKIHKSGKRYGDVVYGSLYMQKGGKATVSDWINRMNNYLK